MARPFLSIEDYITGIRSADRVILGRAISLIESAKPEHQEQAEEIFNRLMSEPSLGQETLRIAVTGAPGAGKSTFIEAMGMYLVGMNKKVAVLAIDPTSSISKGSILGDKTRMERLSASEKAFIRPSPSGESLGGVARKTRETMLLIEAAGYDTVLLETVGVGQSEFAAHSMTDIFLLLLLPGAGDELQGIKRGIMEMADILIINKADGERRQQANQARAHYLNAVHLLPPQSNGWAPQVLPCSSTEGIGLEKIWQAIEDFRAQTKANGAFQVRRQQQAAYWFTEALQAGLLEAFFKNQKMEEQIAAWKQKVLAGQVSPFAAASALLKAFFQQHRP